MFMNVVAIMIDYVGFFSQRVAGFVPQSLFFRPSLHVMPFLTLLVLWHVSSRLVHFCHETNARKNIALFRLFYILIPDLLSGHPKL